MMFMRKPTQMSAMLIKFDWGRLNSGEAASLRGTLGLAEGQLLGRGVRKLVTTLGSHTPYPPKGNRLKEELVMSRREISYRLRRSELDLSIPAFSAGSICCLCDFALLGA